MDTPRAPGVHSRTFFGPAEVTPDAVLLRPPCEDRARVDDRVLHREARVTRWALASLGALLVLGVATVALSRLFGRSGSRAAILVSVVAHWLGAWVLWSFAGGLAPPYGLLGPYPRAFFGLLAPPGAILHYPTAAAARRARG